MTSPRHVGPTENRDAARTAVPWLRILLGFLIGLVFLTLLYRQIDIAAWRESLREADYAYLPFVFLLLLVRWTLAGLRWRTLLWPVSPEPLIRSMAVVTATAAGNLAVPGRAGEAWRAHFVGRGSGVSRSTIFGIIVVERVLDGLIAVLVAFIFVMAVAVGLIAIALITAPALSLTIAALSLAILSRSERARTGLIDWLTNIIPQRFQALASDKAELFMDGVRQSGASAALLRAAALTAAIIAVEGLALYLLGEALGFNLTFWEYVPVMAIANLSTAIPVSIGGIGPFEYFVTASLRLLDIESSPAAAFAVALHALINLAILTSALATAWALRLPLPAPKPV